MRDASLAHRAPQFTEGGGLSHQSIVWQDTGIGHAHLNSGSPFGRAARALVFAHRGGAALAPENTFTAFDRGLAYGADGLELDVRLSADGHAVVFHDATLERTTSEHGPLAARTADALARVDAGYWFGAQTAFPYRGGDCRIPRLRDVLARYPGVPIIIEVKTSGRELVEAVIRDVRAAAAEDRVCIGSFHLSVVRAARAIAPRLATSAAREETRLALWRSWLRWPARSAPYAAFQVPERSGVWRIVMPPFIEAAHRTGVLVQVWTVDRREDIERLLAWGVDGIITDRPDVAVPLVTGVGSQTP